MTKNRAAQAPVIMKPIGKIAIFMPGSTNAAPLCAAADAADGEAAAAAVSPWPAKTPATKYTVEASVRFVEAEVLDVGENASSLIVGMRRAMRSDLMNAEISWISSCGGGKGEGENLTLATWRDSETS